MKKESRGERTPFDIILGSNVIRLDFDYPRHVLLFGALLRLCAVLPPGGVQDDPLSCVSYCEPWVLREETEL